MSARKEAADIASARLQSGDYAANFCDIHPPLNKATAAVESDRCYFCHDAPCQTACPTSIDIPLFIRQIMTDNPKGAAKTIFDENILGGMCARVCPTETLCEEACVRNTAEDKPVEIGLLQRYATDTVLEAGDMPYSRAASTGKKVAVVGAGPAGLSCAHRLSMHGHDVTVYDARPKAGGLNEFGIAAYKSVDNFAAREVDWLLSIGGIAVETGKALGTDLSLDGLRNDFDAVFLGLGMGATNALGLDGEDLDGVEDAVDYIEELRQADDLSALAVGRRVVVIGGGMTAVDMAVQIKLLGAEEVTIAYRRGQENMNASLYEQELAQKKGVSIRHFVQPAGLESEGGVLTGITLEHTALDGAGKLSGTGERFTLAADQVFKAIGQKVDGAVVGDTGLELASGRIAVGEDRKTSLPDVWAGGDCVDGGDDLTVASVEDGKQAAESIHAELMNG